MPVFESSRKVQSFGSSLALTLPAMFVKVNDVEKGSVLKVIYGLDGVLIASQVEDLEGIIERLMAIIDELERSMRARKKRVQARHLRA